MHTILHLMMRFKNIEVKRENNCSGDYCVSMEDMIY